MSPPEQSAAVTFGPFTFDRVSRLLRRGPDEIPLPPRVLGVLELLLERAGAIVPRQEIIDTVWKEAFVTDTSLAEAISVLRQALGDDPQSPTYIQTVHRRGYRFVAPVAEAASRTTPAPLSTAPDEVTKVTPSIGGALVPWGIAALCTLAAVVAIWQFTHRQEPIPPVVRMRIDPTAGTTLDARAPALALSPDGTRLVFAACDGAGCRLYLRPIDRLDAVALAGTDDGSAPFFSPDGRWIGFFGGGKLKKAALSGGAAVVLAEARQTFGAAWLPDGTIVFADSRFTGLKRVSDAGGIPAPLTEMSPGEIGHAWPSVLAGGHALMFSVATSPLERGAGPIAVVPYGAGNSTARRPTHVLIDAAEIARAAGSEYIAYSRGGDLHVMPFDAVRLAGAGAEQVPVTGMAPAQFAVADSGTLAYGAAAPRDPSSYTFWPGSDVIRMDAVTGAAALSPDGRRVAVIREDDAASDVWVTDPDRGATTRLTYGGINVAPVWSDDGSTIYYASRRDGRFEIWRRDSAAASSAVRLDLSDTGRMHVFPSSAAAGTLAFTAVGPGTSVGIVPARGGPPVNLVDTAFDDVAGVLSPDGRLLAYQSDESGRWEIYTLRIADKHRAPVSAEGGTAPFWSRDGRALYYTSGGDLMRTAIGVTGDPGRAAVATPLDGARAIGATPDGRVLLVRDSPARPKDAVVTIEWGRELRRLLGPPSTTLPR